MDQVFKQLLDKTSVIKAYFDRTASGPYPEWI